MPGSEDETYMIFTKAGEDHAGALKMVGPQFQGMPPHWMMDVDVDDCDATVAKVPAAGGTVLAEPFDVPGIGRMAVVADPQGAVFSIMTSAG